MVTVPQSGEGIVGGPVPGDLLGGQQALLQLQDPAAGAEPDRKLMDVERLRDVVVGTGVHPFDQVLLAVASGEQDRVDVWRVGPFPEATAEIDAVEPGHHPVEDGEPRGVVPRQDLPGLVPIAGTDHLVPGPGQDRLQEPTGHTVVLGDQDPHGEASVVAAAGTGSDAGSDAAPEPGLGASRRFASSRARSSSSTRTGLL